VQTHLDNDGDGLTIGVIFNGDKKGPGLVFNKKTALLTDPWVFGAAWQGGSVSAEGEHGQSDECFGGAESERNPGQESDFGVGGFDQSLG